MTGKPEHNFPAFNQAALMLAKDGWEPLNPADNFDGDTSLEWVTYMREDIGMLLKADAIYFLPGWQNSKGARTEHNVAKALGLEFLYHPDASDAHPIEDEAASIVRNGARQEVYGHPAEDFTRTAQIWGAILETEVTPQQVALMMIGLKMSRLVSTPGHRDSVMDAIGYAICYDRVTRHQQGEKDS